MGAMDWISTTIDVDEAAGLTGELVAIRSYPGEEAAVQQRIAAWCRAQGLEPELQALPDGRHNVIVTVSNGDGPTLLLNGHVDTVLAAQGWESDPWTPRREGERLYGLGAADMKSGVAAALLATRALHRQRDTWRGTVVCTTVVDEEAYSAGAVALVKRGLRADACIVTESNWDEPVIGGVGKVLVRAEITGKAAHGSWPADGINAAVEGARMVARLDELPLGQHPHMTATQCVLGFHSGSEQYVITVPERARFTINRHTVPGESDESILADMRALADSMASPATFEFAIDLPYYPPWETDLAQPVVQHFIDAHREEIGGDPRFSWNQGVADTNYFAADLGIPCVQFGPRGGQYHQANEWVDVPSIATAARVILHVAAGLCAG
jgi:acetylornithine deacetylase/succinyl-diaminopimelate desuccinylase-like protein